MSAQAALDCYKRARDRHLEDLKSLLRIPSVSASGFDPQEVRRSAEAVAALLWERGLEHVEMFEVDGSHPYVYGDWLHAPGKPTILLYAHHDVQTRRSRGLRDAAGHLREKPGDSPPCRLQLRRGPRRLHVAAGPRRVAAVPARCLPPLVSSRSRRPGREDAIPSSTRPVAQSP